MPFNNTNTSFHNTIHNTLLEAGWMPKSTTCSSTTCSSTTSASNSTNNKFIYRNKDPYDEFSLEYMSTKDVMITVPIPFHGSSLAYQKTFSTDNIAIILNYLQIHLGNYQ
jgi:hypothetical protein